MGLDITLKARNKDKIESESCYNLSRTFCRLVCDLADMETIVPELLQLFELYQVNGEPLVQANVWEMDQRILYGAEPGLTKGEVDAYHTASWQPAERLLSSFSDLHTKLEGDPSLLNKLNFNYEWVEGYFTPTQQSQADQRLNDTFREDLMTAIQFLAKLPPNSEARFNFF